MTPQQEARLGQAMLAQAKKDGHLEKRNSGWKRLENNGGAAAQKGKPKVRSKRPPAEITLHGMTFRSRADLAALLGIQDKTLYEWLSPRATSGQKANLRAGIEVLKIARRDHH